MINFKSAKSAFESYLDEYNRGDEKIRLKIAHTYCVVDCAEEIARRMGLPAEDVELAGLIGLLHDIGRFEQIRLFNSFQPDTMDHAAFGAQLLFGEQRLIRRFIEDESFDELIHAAIAKHSDFELKGISDERTLLHARLIRDADKLDNCRVKLDEDIEAMMGVPEEDAGKGFLSEKVWEACLARRSVLSADRQTPVDYWMSYIAQYFDVNFQETFDIMREQNYIPRIIHRLRYQEKDTREKMEYMLAVMEEYTKRGGKGK